MNIFKKSAPALWDRAELTSTAKTVLKKRYLHAIDGQTQETAEDMFYRVAMVVAAVESDYGHDQEQVEVLATDYYQMMVDLDFMPNSPTLMNAGRDLGQLSACFVLPVKDSMEEIFDAIKFAAIIHKSGGGTGFSFSQLRPKNSVVRTTGGVASGPISFMKVFNAATEAVKQGGTRRGANMGILRIDHPDILEFIRCKEDNNEITNFNISVGITEEFMAALQAQGSYDLIDPHTKKAVGQLAATDVFNEIVDHAWRNGEPGVIFLDRLNKDNPTPNEGEIEATNPCGEQPLLPNEACNLGSINLRNMVKEEDGRSVIDWDHLAAVTKLAVRFLDDVIDANQYPLEIIDQTVKANRKIGLGVMGFADLLIKLGLSYASVQAVQMAQEVMSFIQETGRQQSELLAAERGTFPNFSTSIYNGKRNLRNATITTIAPTGTISMICGASSGVEPLFAVAYTKTVLDGTPFIEVNPLFSEMAKKQGFYSAELMDKIAKTGSVQGLEEVPADVQRLFVTAQEIDPQWHIRIQAAFQQYTDNAVSKTINFANSATREDICRSYLLAYELNCKGLTVYRDGSRDEQILSAGTAADQAVEENKTSLPAPITPRPRPEVTVGVTEKIKIGCGNLYVSVNADEQGLCEVFTNTGRAGGCSSQSEATARLISLSLRSGISPEAIFEQIRGIRCPACIRREGVNVTSCPDAIARVIKKYQDVEEGLELSDKNDAYAQKASVNSLHKKGRETVAVDQACPDCGMPVNHESGCIVCASCGYSKCG
ncbi:MAG: vitamin B12-dependent ribonucleotide reductase [Bacillota bacterium]|jgi:ribonucleoside-diphosphate reductase alpha chain